MANEKLREAVELAMSVLCRNKADAPYRAWCEYDNAIEKCKAALAAPPRNCDVGTAEEQGSRFAKFCLGKYCRNCPLFANSGKVECELGFLQMPYEEGAAK